MIASLLAISFDCTDAVKLADFWAAAFGRSVVPGGSPESARVAVVDPAATGPLLLFHQVPESKVVKNRVHLDLSTSDAAADTERLLGLGARVLNVFEADGKHRWTTFADPEGNEFDLVSV
ncbi:MAG TPA: VOC family protein [Streptosporangiaceae bacterium]|jgi:predicted enzyme related to lactoylglutathione lyase